MVPLTVQERLRGGMGEEERPKREGCGVLTPSGVLRVVMYDP